MTQQEHLNRIRAHCVELLENGSFVTSSDSCYIRNRIEAREVANRILSAEAGWRATIAAIDGFLAYEQSVLTTQVEREYASMQLTAIIASWPEELL